METQKRRSAAASRAVHDGVASLAVPALVGGLVGAIVAIVLPSGDQGDVLSATPASSKS